MGWVFAFASQKGGVGKTTSSAALAAACAEQGRRVLLVDLDPQAGLTTSLGVDPGALQTTVYSVLVEDLRLSSVAVATKIAGISLVPANLDLAGAEAELIGEVAWERTLKDAIEQFNHDYDLIILDCPPSLGVLTINALVAADVAVVPLQCEFLALRALKQFQAMVAKIRRKANRSLQVRILRTFFDQRTLHAREVSQEIERVAPDEILPIRIKRTIRLADAAAAGETIVSYDKGSETAKAYRELAQELDRMMSIKRKGAQ